MRLHLAARQFLEVPFLHQGRNPKVAIDCIGLGILACQACGIPVVDSMDYSRHPHAGLLEKHLLALFGPPLPISEMRVDDIVSLRYGGPVRHVGIVGEITYGGETYLSLIHTDSKTTGKVAEHRITEELLDQRKRPCIAGVYRPRAV